MLYNKYNVVCRSGYYCCFAFLSLFFYSLSASPLTFYFSSTCLYTAFVPAQKKDVPDDTLVLAHFLYWWRRRYARSSPKKCSFHAVFSWWYKCWCEHFWHPSEQCTCDVIISFVESVHFPKSSLYVSFHTSVDFSVHCSGWEKTAGSDFLVWLHASWQQVDIYICFFEPTNRRKYSCLWL